MSTIETGINELEEMAARATPEQRRQVAAELGIAQAVSRWQAEDNLKIAKRRHEGKQAALQAEQRKFAEVEAAERQTFEHRLEKMRKPLTDAEHEAVEAQQVLDGAEADLAAAVAAEGQHTA